MTISKDPPKGKPKGGVADRKDKGLDRAPSPGAVRFREGHSMSDRDLIDAAIYGSRERPSSSDSD